MEQNVERRKAEEPPILTTQVLDWRGRQETILVPLDGSTEAKVALPVARLIASVTGAAVHVLHVAKEPLAQHQLLRVLKLSRRSDTVGLMIEQTAGDPVEEIVRSAAEKHVMLIVMTTRGHSPYQGQTLRPVPERVLHEAPCPVVLVRPEIAPRVNKQRALRRILLPLDGAPSTMSVIGPAVRLAEDSKAELEVLCVAEVGARQAMEAGTLSTPRYVDQPQYEWPAWVQEYLDRFNVFLREEAEQITLRLLVRRGDPKVEILNIATEHDSDLVVVEWRGRFDPTHASVVRDVLGEANCPVLLLRTVSS